MAGQPGGAAKAPAAADPAAMKYMALSRSFMSRFFDVAEQAVRDGDAATWGIAINPDGLKISYLAEFAPGTTSAQAIAPFKGTDQSMFKGLPQAKYLFVGGIETGDAPGVAKLISDFMAPVETEVTALGSDGKAIQDYIDAIQHFITATKSTSSGMLTPTGPLGQDAIFQMLSVTSGDSKAILDAQKDMAASQQVFMDTFAAPQMRGMMKSSFKADAKTIDGVSFNEVQMQFTQPPPGQRQNPQAMQMKQMMTWMYGPNGMGGLIGALDANKVVGSMGAKDEMVSQLIASAKTGEDVLSKAPSIAAVQKELPTTRVFAGYFALDQVATTIAGYAKMFGSR